MNAILSYVNPGCRTRVSIVRTVLLNHTLHHLSTEGHVLNQSSNAPIADFSRGCFQSS